MAKTPRIVLAGFPHHVTQQGHNKAPLFIEEADYRYYLATLAEWKEKLGCLVYRHCLMTTHVHLMIDPGNDPANLGKLMKRVSGRYTRYVNRREGRTGTVWNARYDSSPIQTDLYFHACGRYIERNPVRAVIVATPEEYPWSSYRHWTGLETTPWLDEHWFDLARGRTPEERHEAHRQWVHAAIPEGEWSMIRTATRRGHVIGGERFIQEIERRLRRRIVLRGPGRPQKALKDR